MVLSVVVAYLALVAVFGIAHEYRERSEYASVTLDNLLAHPYRYDGRGVVVTGRLTLTGANFGKLSAWNDDNHYVFVAAVQDMSQYDGAIVTVKGRVVAGGIPIEETTPDELAILMVGREPSFSHGFNSLKHAPSKPITTTFIPFLPPPGYLRRRI